ncbi:MAG: hypothetical protein JNN00_11685 [Chitinophagaceae bacterium]|nr:hypothetical protein [Chitinophagaceae bacterium]
MNKTDAKKLMMKYLLPQIEKIGYKERGKGAEFEIVRKIASGEDIISGGFTDYNPIQKIIYGCNKRHEAIIAILKSLEEKGVILSPPISRHTITIGFRYETLNGLNFVGYLPEMETEVDVKKCVDKMLDFLHNIAFPLLDKFNDLREIDMLINGEQPWTTDYRMPYALGGNFYEKRLIIAKLSGNPNFQSLIDFCYDSLEQLSAKSGHPFTYNRNDMTKPLPALIKLLQGVKSLY